MFHTTSLLCIASAVILSTGCRSSATLGLPDEPTADAGAEASATSPSDAEPAAPIPTARAGATATQGTAGARPAGSGDTPAAPPAAGSGGSAAAANAGTAGSPPAAPSGTTTPPPAAGPPAANSGNKPPVSAVPDPTAPIDCTRRGLRALIDRYFAALAARDPRSLPQTASIKATENCRPSPLGEGIWRSAGKLSFERSALDSERCGTVSEAVIEVAGAPTVVGVRLKLEDNELSEVETFVTTSVALPATSTLTPTPTPTTLPGGLLDSAAQNWGPSPGSRAQTRQELEQIADTYLRSFGDSTVPVRFDSPCEQRINGNSTGQVTCTAVTIPATPFLTIGEPAQRRFPVIDIENGIAVGFAIVVESYPTPMFAMLKVNDGRIRYIDTVLSTVSKTSGWE